ncbi:MAG: DUF1501 domain-containing protein [Saprospiraceae bacterium]|nr:DUF1501 domain-containing protein [Saprospiraceae bacterium]
MSKRKISRRDFLGEAACAALGSMTLYNSFVNLGLISAAATRPHVISNPNDYKAMVCILLAGGADSYNFLVPTEPAEYAQYVTTRGSLALSNSATPTQLLPLNYNNNGRTFSVNAAMAQVQNLFNTGKLSFVSNIGTLIEPIANKTEYTSGTKKIPLGLYSHSDQIMQWQTSVPQSRSAVGVAGRMADILHDLNTIPEASMNISLAGKNRWQSGNETNEFSISNSTTAATIGYTNYSTGLSNAGFLNDLKNDAMDGLATQQYANLFHQTIGQLNKSTSESIELYKVALSNLVPLATPFSATNLSNDLKKIAELIKVRSFLGAQRQTFFVSYGGWDHHDDVINNQNLMLPILSNALNEFNNAITELNLQDNVVTFTISDFARTLTSNGNGSDHAWGGNSMIMGGPINGGQIFGDYPSLSLTSPLNLSSRGLVLPTTSVDEFYAEIALWFGVSPNDLSYILPNICNFYSPNSCPAPVPSGYMPIGMF